MTPILISIIITAAIIMAAVITAWREAQKYGTTTAEEFVGICNVALDRTVRKRANTDTIISLFAKKPELSNSEIRRALKVSSRTAVRYMDALEKEGKVKQVGKTGHTVTYRLK